MVQVSSAGGATAHPSRTLEHSSPSRAPLPHVSPAFPAENLTGSGQGRAACHAAPGHTGCRWEADSHRAQEDRQIPPHTDSPHLHSSGTPEALSQALAQGPPGLMADCVYI